VSEQEKEVTQPVVVNGATASHSAEEGTQPVKVTDGAPQAQLPDWLLKFASSPEQEAENEPLADESGLLSSFSDDFEEEEAFTPPPAAGEYEWQELSDFQEQDAMDLEPLPEAQEISTEVDFFEAPEAGLDGNLDEVTETLIVVDPQVEAANNFSQEVRDLLKQGQREEALAMIRQNKADPVLAEAAKKTLRSQLTLSSDTGDLWEIYDELSSSSL
jgi:hypothetical protein